MVISYRCLPTVLGLVIDRQICAYESGFPGVVLPLPFDTHESIRSIGTQPPRVSHQEARNPWSYTRHPRSPTTHGRSVRNTLMNMVDDKVHDLSISPSENRSITARTHGCIIRRGMYQPIEKGSQDPNLTRGSPTACEWVRAGLFPMSASRWQGSRPTHASNGGPRKGVDEDAERRTCTASHFP